MLVTTLVAVAVLLALSAFFAGSETALTALIQRDGLYERERTSTPTDKIAVRMRFSPRGKKLNRTKTLLCAAAGLAAMILAGCQAGTDTGSPAWIAAWRPGFKRVT